MPETLSMAVPVTVTVLSLWFGGQRVVGWAVSVRSGGVVSILTRSVWGASTLPLASVEKNCTTSVPLSLRTTWLPAVYGPLLTRYIVVSALGETLGSVAVKVIVTGLT